MAAPNIVGVTSIVGVSTFISGISSTAYTTVLSNAANSNQVWKVNTLVASNTTAASIYVSLKFFGQAAGVGNSVSMGSTIAVPIGSSLVLIGKDNPVYLEENRSIAMNASAANSADVVISYESIA